MSQPIAFSVAGDHDTVAPILDRVRAYRMPRVPAGCGWRYGCDPDVLRRLCAFWTDGYDWRQAVATLNRHPQFLVGIDGETIHYQHIVGEAEGRRPLLLTHGWPGSTDEFRDLVGPLAFPTAHGGSREDAFDLVIPTLPGFGFSGRPAEPVDQVRTAALFDRLMTRVLGYPRYRAHGGDWGAQVTTRLALNHADHVEAIHLTMLFPAPEPETPAEAAWAARMPPIEEELGGYRHLQASKPVSLGYAMVDNPVAQLAWIVERFHDWSDRRGRPFEEIFPAERLLTNAMIYIATGAFETASWYYAAARESGLRTMKPDEFVSVPTAFARFPDPLHPWPPRSLAEKGFALSRWTEMPHGGHFAGLEAPGLLVADLRAWAATER